MCILAAAEDTEKEDAADMAMEVAADTDTKRDMNAMAMVKEDAAEATVKATAATAENNPSGNVACSGIRVGSPARAL